MHDPANPIIEIHQELRDDLCAWMDEWKLKADLCVAMGTSLSGSMEP